MSEQVKPCQKVRLTPELWAQIDKQAAVEERSRNKMIELLIRRGLGDGIQAVIKGSDIKTMPTKATFGNISYDPNKIKL